MPQQIVELFPLEASPIERFGELFGLDFIVADDLAKPGGIAAATHIFQQQGVVKIAQKIGRKMQFSADAHAQHTGTQRVTWNGTLRQIECKGKGFEQIAETDLLLLGGRARVLLRGEARNISMEVWCRPALDVI